MQDSTMKRNNTYLQFLVTEFKYHVFIKATPIPICTGDRHIRSCVMAGSAKIAVLWDVTARSLVDGANICELNGASFSHLPCIYFLHFQSYLSFSPFTHIPSSHT
jgi:hypothetical protein